MDSIKDRLPVALRTERLLLTNPTMAHAPAIAQLANNARIHKVMSRLPFPYLEENARFFVEQIVPSPEELCYAILLGGDTFMGIAGLTFPADLPPELGYWLGEPFWGKGYATEAALAVTAAARAAGIPELRSRALLSNQGSRNVLRKAGFRETGETVDGQGTLAGQRVMQMRLEFPGMIPIRTPRLILRESSLADAPCYALGVSEYEVAKFLTPVPYPYTLAMAIDWLRQARPATPERSMLMVELPGKGVIGCVSLIDELGFWIARPHWNRGYVTEAASAVLDWHFSQTNAETVTSSAHHNNIASLAVQRKLGFVPTGRDMRFSQTLQHNVEHVVTQLTRAAWLARGFEQ